MCHICLEIGQEDAAADGSLVCRRHADRIWGLLNEAVRDYLIVSDPEYLVSTAEPASDYTKGRPPCSLSPIALTDRRTRYTGKGSPVSAERVYWAWACAISEARGEQYPEDRGIIYLTGFLKARMVWVCQQPAVARFARHVACVADCLRRELPSDPKEDDGEDTS